MKTSAKLAISLSFALAGCLSALLVLSLSLALESAACPTQISVRSGLWRCVYGRNGQ